MPDAAKSAAGHGKRRPKDGIRCGMPVSRRRNGRQPALPQYPRLIRQNRSSRNGKIFGLKTTPLLNRRFRRGFVMNKGNKGTRKPPMLCERTEKSLQAFVPGPQAEIRS
ncbi:hypothetical protein B4135_1268 [Caldibacillus debilis]|uniref:Uncharacterized protein n=1 Tax=Caldibacillus debilis TaxID=301148 RepID=A0A150MDJ9_9BACI|nr:hypothetical protein B4135_1268 [Caldibacillus debilis]MBO2482488.1 hypothetical protein [Bacillaceae bacterium]